MSNPLNALRSLIQQDINARGLASDPVENLLTYDTFPAACQELASPWPPSVLIVTGFFIPQATPPADETDGPLGALFLARALTALGGRVALASDASGRQALTEGLQACNLSDSVPWVGLSTRSADESATAWVERVLQPLKTARFPALTHLVALERVGPAHTVDSVGEDRADFVTEVPAEEHDRCHNMRGRDITPQTAPAHLLLEQLAAVRTIGIGDGGNEIGMGCVPWRVVRRNIARGGLIACRVRTDHLIVCGVSNWGAYALAAGLFHLLEVQPPSDLFDPEREQTLLRIMVERGPLVDGVTGKQTVTVDGVPFERYSAVLPIMRQLIDQS